MREQSRFMPRQRRVARCRSRRAGEDTPRDTQQISVCAYSIARRSRCSMSFYWYAPYAPLSRQASMASGNQRVVEDEILPVYVAPGNIMETAVAEECVRWIERDDKPFACHTPRVVHTWQRENIC